MEKFNLDQHVKFQKDEVVYITTADTFGRIYGIGVYTDDKCLSIQYGVRLFTPEAVYPYTKNWAIIEQQFLEKVS